MDNQSQIHNYFANSLGKTENLQINAFRYYDKFYVQIHCMYSSKEDAYYVRKDRIGHTGNIYTTYWADMFNSVDAWNIFAKLKSNYEIQVY